MINDRKMNQQLFLVMENIMNSLIQIQNLKIFTLNLWKDTTIKPINQGEKLAILNYEN